MSYSACLGLLALAGAWPKGGGELPPLPGAFHLSSIAREMSGYATGEILATRAAPDGAECPVRLRVGGWAESSFPPGEEVAFDGRDGHAPVQLGSPAGPAYTYRKQALCIFNASRRLLVVSYENDSERVRLLSALGTARFRSSRFSEEELDWAWCAARGCAFDLPKPGIFGLEGCEALPGHVELVLRFGGYGKQEILDGLRAQLALGAADVEMLDLSTRDVGGVQDLAVRALLEHGRRVEPTPYLSMDNRLRARLAQGEPDARSELIERLERAQRAVLWNPRMPHTAAELEEYETTNAKERMGPLLEIAAYGAPADRPRLRAFVQKGVESSVYAWLALGGSAQEVLECQSDLLQIPPWDLVRAGTIEALRLELARVRRMMEVLPVGWDSELQSVDALVRRLQPRQPKEVLELVQPVLRACLERSQGPGHFIRTILLRAGDPHVLAEFGRMSADEIGQGVPPVLAEAPGEEGVAILVKLLVRSLAGFEWDDTCQAQQSVAYLAQRLHERSKPERALALQLFDAAELPARASADDVTSIRWALGELPEPQRLLTLHRSLAAVACRLDLAAEAAGYAGVLGELRKDPREHWFALALLHDEVSLPVFGAWLAGAPEAPQAPQAPQADDRRPGPFDALLALEKMGSPAGAEWIWAALPRLNRGFRNSSYAVLGEIEPPAQLGRLASASAVEAEPDRPAGHAFLLALGRRR